VVAAPEQATDTEGGDPLTLSEPGSVKPFKQVMLSVNILPVVVDWQYMLAAAPAVPVITAGNGVRV